VAATGKKDRKKAKKPENSPINNIYVNPGRGHGSSVPRCRRPCSQLLTAWRLALKGIVWR